MRIVTEGDCDDYPGCDFVRDGRMWTDAMDVILCVTMDGCDGWDFVRYGCDFVRCDFVPDKMDWAQKTGKKKKKKMNENS